MERLTMHFNNTFKRSFTTTLLMLYNLSMLHKKECNRTSGTVNNNCFERNKLE